jgi:hypothetical protein
MVETSLHWRIEISLHWRAVANTSVATNVQAPRALAEFLVLLYLSEIEFDHVNVVFDLIVIKLSVGSLLN